MRKISLLLVLLIASYLICSCDEHQMIRKDLAGNQLVADDFKIILDKKIVDAFIKRDDLPQIVTGLQVEKATDFKSGYQSKDVRQSVQVPTWNYQNKKIRFVYLDDSKNGKETNGYTELGHGSMTLRGGDLGDTIDKVIQLYGSNEWALAHKSAWYKGRLTFGYKLFIDKKFSSIEYPLYDELRFEFIDGRVVCISYLKSITDEP